MPTDTIKWIEIYYKVLDTIIVSRSTIGSTEELPIFGAFKYGGSGVMVDPSPHPQHMNGLKHLVYVCSGCGNHSM